MRHRLRTILVACLVITSLSAAAAEPAAARPCSDRVPVFVNGTQWIVYAEGRVKCWRARRAAKLILKGGPGPRAWKCSRRKQRCHRGGTYIDRWGNRRFRRMFGWHLAD